MCVCVCVSERYIHTYIHTYIEKESLNVLKISIYLILTGRVITYLSHSNFLHLDFTDCFPVLKTIYVNFTNGSKLTRLVFLNFVKIFSMATFWGKTKGLEIAGCQS